ncbi:mycofactocin biosynthesis chaperone MftB [Mycobacterium sp. CBMA271]|uniref:mycofactocin biosynthesis chaperone MftB n=1 Tax=unclassified Mycobacteroides TaxID=2618759 RepID=UPI0012DE51F0|nr:MULTISPECIES: mycofactocin biosynthesis chaperone MftB [unclassified Mycobacteroides]MUM18249.1 mycofactocin system protein MftB [Mycobacteroides sp. CBMA 326]MUM20836.1 mycofactocin biosynthesis chaperone MftB [Mycobacteroides sp. CBMA 271]
MSAMTDEAPAGFDWTRPWQLHPQVSLRPEPFGALLYHFGTRKLSFLKNRTLLQIVQSLTDHSSAESAWRAAGVGDAQVAAYQQALAMLADSTMIVTREDAP